MAVIRNTACL